MSNLINRLKLAKLLQAFAETATEEGVTFTYEGDLEVGTEVFMTNEENDLVPVSDGVYTFDGKLYTVVSGVVTVIEEKEPAPAEEEEPTPEETPAEEPAPVEEEEPAEEPAEEPKEEEEPKAEEEEPAEEETPAPEEESNDEVESLKNEIAEKDAKISELEAKIAELEAKIAEAEKPVDEPADNKFSKQKDEKKEKDEYNIVAALRKIKNEE